MPRPYVRIPVHVEHLTNDTDLWCYDCGLSTGVRVWFTAAVAAGPTLLRSTSVCTECGGHEIEA